MDALKFLEEKNRMCDEHPACVGCPLGKLAYCADAEPEEQVKAVEAWSKEHPLTTNGMKVLEFIHGNVRDTTIIKKYPSTKDYVEICIEKSWWDAEYEGEE